MPETATPKYSMSQVTAGMVTKSEKIRALHSAGFRRSDIARFLDVRYQFVRNVLVQAEQKAGAIESAGLNDRSVESLAPSMSELTSALKTKAEKIRTLHRAGYSRSDIARFLDIRYQHVRNVVVHAAEKAPPAYGGENKTQEWIEIGTDGHMVVPARYRRVLGVENGGLVMLKVDGDQLRLLNRSEALRQAQALVAAHLAKGASMVDELVSDRRAEAKREDS